MSKCEREYSKREGRWARLDHATNGSRKDRVGALPPRYAFVLNAPLAPSSQSAHAATRERMSGSCHW